MARAWCVGSLLLTACAPAPTHPELPHDTDREADTVISDTDVIAGDTDAQGPPRCGARGRTLRQADVPRAWETVGSPDVVDRRADGVFALSFWDLSAGPSVQLANPGEALGEPEIQGDGSAWGVPARRGSVEGGGTTLWFPYGHASGWTVVSHWTQVSLQDPTTDWQAHTLDLVQSVHGTPSLLDVRDVDGDGSGDAVLVYRGTAQDRVGVFTGPFTGAWTALTTPADTFAAGPDHQTMPLPIVSDLVGTPDADLVVVDRVADDLWRVRVIAGPLVGVGDPASPVTILVRGAPVTGDPGVYDAVRAGDVDGDGHADLLIANPRLGLGRVDVYRGPLAPGELEPSDAWATVEGSSTARRLGDQLRLWDMDGDGADDVVVSEVEVATVAPPESVVPARWSVWTGLAAGARTDFDVALVGPGWTAWEEPFVGDADGDGVPELSVAVRRGVGLVTLCERP